ncbi:MAG: ABC transporter permease [Deltaproteobacteria bacterium]|nr:ABC transporter permease [Deltaproteobacteria bacterium]
MTKTFSLRQRRTAGFHKIIGGNLQAGLKPILALTFGLTVGAVAILALGKSPFAAYEALIQGAFGSRENLAGTLIKTTPLILTGLAVAVAFRAGLFNIGAEGQLYMGGIAATWAGIYAEGVPGSLHIILVFLAGFFAGAVWGAIPGWLKAHRGVHEVINTIMMNYLAIYFTTYMVMGPMSVGDFTNKTHEIASTAKLGVLWDIPAAELSWGLLLAIAAAFLIHILLRRTTMGFQIQAVGYNPAAARYSGICVGRTLVLVMALCGGCAGLAGTIEVTGLHHRFYAQFSPGYGFDGIAVALLARNHPLGILLAALLFGALRTSDRLMQLQAGVPRDMVFVVQAAVIFFMSIDILRPISRRWREIGNGNGRRKEVNE